MDLYLLRTLPIGHAVEFGLNLPFATVAWHVLRRTNTQFPEDPLDFTGSVVVHAQESAAPPATYPARLLDLDRIQHGVTYYYRAYAYDGATWTQSAIASITPQPAFADFSLDPQTLVRDRLILGLQDEVTAQRLRPTSGVIPVLTAPPQIDATSWPLVTVHLDADTAAERAIGEQLAADVRQSSDGDWRETEGWLSSVELSVIGWSQNADERTALRHALKRQIIGNLPVFAAQGLITPEWSQRDSEDFTTFNAPVYQTVGTFRCLAPSSLTWTVPDITAVTVHGDAV